MAKVLVEGSLAYDRIMDFAGLFAEHFMPDKLHNINLSFQVDTLVEHFGGTAGNIAYNLALLKEESVILSNGGKDFEKYRAHLDELGIAHTQIPSLDAFTSVAHIMTDRGDNQITSFYMGAGATAYAGTYPDTADLAIIGAGNIEDMRRLAAHCKKHGIPYFYDPGQAMTAIPDDDMRSCVEGATGVFANDYEFALIMKKTGWSEADIASRVQFVIVTKCEQGSRIVTKEGEETVAAVPARKVLDPTGAGDAYRAGFIKGYIAKLPLRQCAQLASTAAVYAVETLGTQEHSFTLQELKERYALAYREEIKI